MRMNVATKLVGGIATVVILTTGAGLVALDGLGKAGDQAEAVHRFQVVGLRDLGHTTQDIDQSVVLAHDFIAEDNSRERGSIEEDIARVDEQVRVGFGRLGDNIASDLVRAALVDLEEAWSRFLEVRDRQLRALPSRLADERAARVAVEEAVEPLREAADNFAAQKVARAEDRLHNVQDTVVRDRRLALVLLGAALLAGLAIAATLARSLVGRVREYSSFTQRVAAGDLTARVEPRGGDELAQLATNLNSMVESLAGISSEVAKGASTISAGTSELLATVNQNTASASQQSAAIQEISATVQEVRASAEQSAQKAEQVARQAEVSKRASEEGAEAVEAIVDGMEDVRGKVDEIANDILALSEKSQQISDITTAVSDLADQANLLALNATIEAARAGEQGKGFAVVADEVRHLAEQSKEATARVQNILGEVQRATNAAVMNAGQGTTVAQRGTELAQRAGEVISELAETVRDAAQAAQQIAASAREQNVGMDQIANSMRDTSQATTQFVSGAQENQSAIGGLDDLARELQQLAARYKLSQSENGGAPALEQAVGR